MGRVPYWEAAEEKPVVVPGAGGMLATALVDTHEEQKLHYLALSEQTLDITSKGPVKTILMGLNAGFAINAAA